MMQACCETDTKPPCCTDTTQTISSTSCADNCCSQRDSGELVTTADCNSPCCTTGERQSIPTPRETSGCSQQTSAKGCCSDNTKPYVNDAIQKPSYSSNCTDLEKGSIEKDHIILSISGMTCTGCETKLKRTLATLNYVGNLKISLILARAEFDIVKGAATADDVIKHLQRTTEFKCEQVSNRGSSLELICSVDPADLIESGWPGGVLEVRRMDKETIRVDFDPKIVGARDLLEHDWSRSLRLAPPRPDSSLDAGSRHVRKMGWTTLLSAILTIPVLIMAWAPLPERDIAYGSASLALATLVQLIIAGPFYPKAVKALVFSRVIEMDLLIVLSTSAAYLFSVVSFGYLVVGKPLSTGEFFATSTLLVTLIMVGRWIASLARQKAAESVSIRSLQTSTAILGDTSAAHKEIDTRLLQYGDVFRVAPDTRIPTDGTIISGSSEVDESMLTGESKPIEKHVGSTVIAGSINGSGMFTARLTRLPGDNTITTIACMVDEAELSKPRIQDIADQVASYFVPVVVTLTIFTFVIWIAIGVAVRHQSASEATIQAITYAITVLIVSCPCAIGLAVPMVIVIASGVAASRGVIFKSASSIEIAYKTTDVVFDKTGTLTLGKLAVVETKYFGQDETDMPLLLGLLADIRHPVSAAVAHHLGLQGIVGLKSHDVKVLPGKGVKGYVDNKRLRGGNSMWLETEVNPEVESMLSQGLTVFCFTINNELVSVFGLQDTARPEAFSTIQHLQQRGLNIHMLSGDDHGAVHAIASQLNIPEDNIRSRCSPKDKQIYIQRLLSERSMSVSVLKERNPIIMFVGDGTNDAVALTQSTIGVHMSSGTDIAQSAADVVLVRPNLSGVITLLAISKKAMRRVTFNFAWSFVYNLFAVLLGAGAFVHARIPPEFAGLGELLSVLPVILAAVLLRWSRI